jgi:hypothetical protein
MKLFDKTIKKQEFTRKAAERIAGGISWLQNRFDYKMQKLTQHWKPKQQWIFLCVFCGLMGGYSILVMMDAFKVSQQVRKILPTPISVPKNIQQTSNSIITENEMLQVQNFMQKNQELQKQRPGLFDSLSQVEELYYSQKNNQHGKHPLR